MNIEYRMFNIEVDLVCSASFFIRYSIFVISLDALFTGLVCYGAVLLLGRMRVYESV